MLAHGLPRNCGSVRPGPLILGCHSETAREGGRGCADPLALAIRLELSECCGTAWYHGRGLLGQGSSQHLAACLTLLARSTYVCSRATWVHKFVPELELADGFSLSHPSCVEATIIFSNPPLYPFPFSQALSSATISSFPQEVVQSSFADCPFHWAVDVCTIAFGFSLQDPRTLGFYFGLTITAPPLRPSPPLSTLSFTTFIISTSRSENPLGLSFLQA